MGRNFFDAIEDLLALVWSYVDEGNDLYDILESEWMKKEVDRISKRYDATKAMTNKIINERIQSAMW